MPNYDTAEELLRPGETGLFLLTDGRQFTVNPNGSGSTGFWAINPDRQVDRVVVFKQQLLHGRRLVELFTAHHDGVVGPTKEGRYTVLLLDVRLVGSTDRCWKDFVEGGSNPVRYFTRQLGS